MTCDTLNIPLFKSITTHHSIQHEKTKIMRTNDSSFFWMQQMLPFV